MRSHALLVLQKTMTLTSLPAAAGRELIPARIDASRASCPPHTPASRPHPPAPRGRREAGGGRRQAHRPASRGLRRAPHSCQCHHSRPASGGVVQRPAPRVYPSCAGPGHGQRFPFLSFPPLTSPSSASLSQQELSGEGEGEAYLRGAPLLLRRGGSSEEALLLQDLSGPAHLPRGLPGGHGLPGLITASAPRSACLSEAPERGALT